MNELKRFELEMRGVEWSRLVRFFRDELNGVDRTGGLDLGEASAVGGCSEVRRFDGGSWRAELGKLPVRRLGSISLPAYRVRVEAPDAELAELRERLRMRFVSAGA